MREKIEQNVSDIAEETFGSKFVKCVYYDSLPNAPTRGTGKYVTIILSTSSVTGEQLEQFTDRGFYFVEQAGHTKKNPDMDKQSLGNFVDSEGPRPGVPLDRLSDAAEVETELILEAGSLD
jgi:hypothetical protein